MRSRENKRKEMGSERGEWLTEKVGNKSKSERDGYGGRDKGKESERERERA